MAERVERTGSGRVPLFQKTADYAQETDSAPTCLAATIIHVNTMTASSPIRSFNVRPVRPLFLVLAAFIAAPFCGGQVFLDIPAPHTTFVVFADHHLDDDQWMALVAELRRSQEDPATRVPTLAGDFEVLRGEDVVPGIHVENGISVFLHGDCTLLPAKRQWVTGALGWVPVANGRTQPFIHVECTRIAEMLGPLVLGMHRDRRNSVMAEAVVRVLIHEWIHVATQTVKHTKEGITKSGFTAADLLAEDNEIHPRPQTGNSKRRQAGL